MNSSKNRFILAGVLLAIAAFAWVMFRGKGATPNVQKPSPNFPKAGLNVEYHRDEGSEMLPLVWAMQLADGKFMNTTNLKKYGFLSQCEDVDKDCDILPIGMTISEGILTSGKKSAYPQSVGINCAACHVAEFRFNGKTKYVDGAPSQFDSSGFAKDLYREAMISLLPSNFQKTLEGVFPNLAALPNKQAIFDQIRKTLSPYSVDTNEQIEAFAQKLATTAGLVPVPVLEEYLPLSSISYHLIHLGKLALAAQNIEKDVAKVNAGRLDDFGAGRIVFWPDSPVTINGPVSFLDTFSVPNADASGFVHWDGNMNSVLDRNIGQAVVGGALYQNASVATVRLENLHKLEEWARSKAGGPGWPEDLFGKQTDAHRVEDGRKLYGLKGCKSCHENRRSISLAVIQTDPNATTTYKAPISPRAYPTGGCGNLSFHAADANAPASIPFKDVSTHDLMLVKNCLFEFAKDMISEETRKKIDPVRNAVWKLEPVYVARPHRSIWATAPYLHNNSVPTLWQVLKPSARPERFRLLNPDYNLEEVGYAWELCKAGEVKCYDTGVSGNSNGGHKSYVEDLTDEQRLDLIAYLKQKKDAN